MTTLPETTHTIQLPSFDRSESDVLPAWVEDLPSRPTVYVTFGTISNRRPGLFETVLDALQAQDVNLIVTVGPNRDPTELGPRPSNVHVERYVPQSLLFSRCDLV
ncbi:MAG: glycosyltransferase, partial [Chloroflexota bacterium]